jgi:small-conductance mechanosensitive channel
LSKIFRVCIFCRAFAAMTVAMAVLLVACGKRELPPVRVAAHEHLPFQALDASSGRPSGFHVELLEEVARRQGLKLEYAPMASPDATVTALSDEDDCAMGLPVPVNPGWKGRVMFSWACSLDEGWAETVAAAPVEAYHAFPVRPGEGRLRELLNAGLRQLMDDGGYARLHGRHFPRAAASAAVLSPEVPAKLVDRYLPALAINESYNAKTFLNNSFDTFSDSSVELPDEQMIKVASGTIANLGLDFADKLRRSQVRLEELILLMESTPQYTPYFGAFYFRQIDDLRRSFVGIRSTLGVYQRRLTSENHQICNHRLMIQRLEIAEPALAWRQGWVEANLHPLAENLGHWQEQVAGMSEQCAEFQAEMARVAALAEDHIHDNYRSYLPHRFGFIGNLAYSGGLAYQWHDLVRSFERWRQELPTQVAVIAAGVSWWPSLLPLALLLALVAGGGTVAIRRFCRCDLNRFRRPWISAWLGIYCGAATIILPNTGDDIFYCLAGLFLAGAIMDTAWRLTWGPDAANRPVNPFLGAIMAFFLMDLLTGLLAPLKVMLTAMLLLSIVNCAWLLLWCARDLRHRQSTATIAWVGGAIWGATALAAWLGYLYPAMVIAVFGGMGLCVGFAGVAFTRVLTSVAADLAGRRRSLASLVSTLIIPFLWLALIFSVVHWAAEIFNAERLFLQYYGLDLIPSGRISVSLRLVVFLFLVALVVKFALCWVTETASSFVANRQIDVGTINSTMVVVKYSAWFVYAIYALSCMQINWDDLKWIIGGLSVGFGFAIKDIIENFFCGIIVLLGKEVRPGDLVEFGDVLGQIEEINVRATFIKTDDNAIISIPNNQIVAKDFRNWTLNDRVRRSQLDVGVAYGSDVSLVMATMLAAMDDCAYVLKAKKPEVLFLNFGDSSLVFRARFWIDIEHRLQAPSAVRQRIDALFRERGVVIAFPQLDVHFDEPGPSRQVGVQDPKNGS